MTNERFSVEYVVKPSTTEQFIRIYDWGLGSYFVYEYSSDNYAHVAKLDKDYDSKLSNAGRYVTCISYTIDEDQFHELLIKLNNLVESNISIGYYLELADPDPYSTKMYNEHKVHGITFNTEHVSNIYRHWKDIPLDGEIIGTRLTRQINIALERLDKYDYNIYTFKGNKTKMAHVGEI